MRVYPGVGEEAAVSFVSCTAQTATPSEWSMVTSSLLELRMPLQLNWAKGERLKLRCVRVGGDRQIGAVGLKARGESVKFAGGMRGGWQKGTRRTVGQWGKSETGWGRSRQRRPQGQAHQGSRSAVGPLDVAGSELVGYRVRVNPSEQQQEGKAEEERREKEAKGASSSLPGRANCSP